MQMAESVQFIIWLVVSLLMSKVREIKQQVIIRMRKVLVREQ